MKHLNRNLRIAIVLTVWLAAAFAAEARSAEFIGLPPLPAGQIIVNATEARVRSAPNLNAKVLGVTRIGTIYQVIGKRTGWYNINFDGNKAGWISATLVEPFSASRRGSIYQSITNKYIKRPALDFDTASELFEFLTGVQPEVAATSVEPELAYDRALALAKALEAIPIEKTDKAPYKDFTAKYADEVAYSEPAGQFAVRTEIWWGLQKTYSEYAIADEMAWQGANTMIPGECEGYVVCHLYVLRETYGRYLELYPSGKYSSRAIQSVREYLQPIADGASGESEISGYYITPDPDDRVQLETTVGELRTISSKIPGSAKTRILELLETIGAGYRLKPADETGLDDFWTEFRSAVVKKDKNTVADMTRFPLQMPYGHDEIKTRSEFLRNYDGIMNLMADSAGCFEKGELSKENGRYGVYCGFKTAVDVEENKPNYYYFEKTAAGWKFVGIDNINE